MPLFYFYNVFGLNVRSSIFFPELIPKKSNSDVTIHSHGYESLFKKKSPKKKDSNCIIFSPNDILYFWDDDPLFRVRYGKEIIVNPETIIDKTLLKNLILGQGFGTLLMQRGNLVFHASSVRIGGKAIAFIGSSGEGKSTLAAALSKRDYSAVTDDVLPLKFNEHNKPLVLPGFPRFKLCNDVMKYITSQSEPLPQINPEIEKYSYNISEKFSFVPLPLKTIYILEKSAKNEITLLKPQEAFIELIKNSYATHLFNNSERSKNLIQCATLAENIPVKRLKRTQSLNKLADLTKLIEKDVITA